MKRRAQRGHVMLELALSAGVMAAALAGTFQFGYTFYVYNQLVTAVGNGGRYAALRTYRAAGPADTEKGKSAIINMVVYGDAHPAEGAAPIIANLKPENVRLEWVAGEGGGAPVAVDVAITGYQVNAIFGGMTLEGKPAVEFPFAGRYAPGESEP